MEDLEPQVLAVPRGAGGGEGRAPPPVVRAEAVSAAVLDLLEGPRTLRVRGEGRGVVHLDLDGAVVTVAAPGVPRMPNAIVARAPAPPFAVAWDPRHPPAWDPVPPTLSGGPAEVRALEAWLAGRVSGARDRPSGSRRAPRGAGTGPHARGR